jgi:hypothetical protein
MSEAGKPKRNFWQFHLFTATLLMFVCSGLLWANVSTYKFYVDSGFQADRAWGWPFPWLIWMDHPVGRDTESHLFLGSILNPAVAVAILGIIAFVSEFIIRRREARKT